jgi:nuclear transport factor 2 (NTF2) superfamily protein
MSEAVGTSVRGASAEFLARERQREMEYRLIKQVWL